MSLRVLVNYLFFFPLVLGLAVLVLLFPIEDD